MLVEQRPAIERHSLFKPARFRELLKLDGVEGDHRGVEADGIMLGSQWRRLAKGAPQLGQSLAQAGPRLLLAAVAPQQRHQLLSRPWLARREHQAGEQRAYLPAERRRVAPLARPQLETAEQAHLQEIRSSAHRLLAAA